MSQHSGAGTAMPDGSSGRGHVTPAMLLVAAVLASAVASAVTVLGVQSPARADEGPSVTAVAPDFGSTSGGTSVTIRGEDLGSASAVEFGTVAATSVTVDSGTTIVAVAPAEPAATVDVRVLTADGETPSDRSDRFTFVDLPPKTVEILPEHTNRSCAGDEDTATWVPPSGATDLSGFEVVVEQVTDSGPTFRTHYLDADRSSLEFEAVNGENSVLVFKMTSHGIMRTPFGTAELTAYGVPQAMAWNEVGANSVSDGSATVSFAWAGPPTSSVTGGDVGADTVSITGSGGLEQSVPASVMGVTVTFTGLSDGTGYTFSDSVSNSCGTSSASPVSPTFTPGVVPSISGSPTDAVVGDPYSYSFAISGDPSPELSVTAGGLPPGLSLANDGTISGIPSAAGTFEATVTASNGVGIAPFSSGEASDSFSITVEEAPSITSGPSATFEVGESGSFELTSTGFPAPELSETGQIPNGLVFDVQPGGTAVISGTPAAGTAGTYPITITASNGVLPDAVQDFVLYVGPTITSPDTATMLAATPFSFRITTAGSDLVGITESGALPTGLRFRDDRHGATLRGTPGADSGGVYRLRIEATFGSGADRETVVQLLTLVVDQPLAITSSSHANATVGHRFHFTVTTAGFPRASKVTESGVLPDGISFSYSGGATAVISGDAEIGTEGEYDVTIRATNDAGARAVQTYILVVRS